MSDTSILKEKLELKLKEYQLELERLTLVAEQKAAASKETMENVEETAKVAINDLSILVDEAQHELSELTEEKWQDSKNRLTAIWEQLRVSYQDAKNKIL